MAVSTPDALIVGAGPNGLSAAVALAREGLTVTVYEARSSIGGGSRTEELTLPGYRHDVCSAIHPTAVVSPFFRDLPLERHGLEWVRSPLALVHAFEDGRVARLHPDLDETARGLGEDGDAWLSLMRPLVENHDALFDSILRPVRIPRHPLLMARFGLRALRACSSTVRKFRTVEARALFAGCAAHGVVPLEKPGTASFGLILALSAHVANWPAARGGSASIVEALAALLREMGGTIETGRPVRKMGDLPPAQAILFDLTPKQIVAIAGNRFPSRYRRRLANYRYGPGTFKIDWALDGPIPWKNPACLHSATVHLGATYEEIAKAENDAWNGVHPDRPFILVAQQSLFDASRAPAGHHTGWAYCHVPHGSTCDMTEAIESALEAHAPGFRDRILARHTITAAGLEQHNENMIGGDIGGGANSLVQFLGRPAFRYDPYSTPDPQLYICSSATPPGGGVHGMGGWNAAQSVLRTRFRGHMEGRAAAGEEEP
jgi:phytoene dehydrogenase-like protein